MKVDGVDPDDVIMSPEQALRRGLTSTVTFPTGNLAPQGSVIKSTAIDPSVVGEDGVYRHTGRAKVFTSERDAVKAIKTGGVQAGDIMVLIGRGPMGTGFEETYQVTSALKHLSFGKHVSLITDARFSGVSTGACIGHVGPEALAGGPIGKLRDGDLIEIVIDRNRLEGSVNFIGGGCEEEKGLSGEGAANFPEHGKEEDAAGRPDKGLDRLSPEGGAAVLARRAPHPGLAADPDLPDDTRLWAALQSVSGGTWRGCVYDVDRIIEVLEAGKKALQQ
jgi:dihydroxyacid dehydratase/phosphogluconate dehydratase